MAAMTWQKEELPGVKEEMENQPFSYLKDNK